MASLAPSESALYSASAELRAMSCSFLLYHEMDPLQAWLSTPLCSVHPTLNPNQSRVYTQGCTAVPCPWYTRRPPLVFTRVPEHSH